MKLKALQTRMAILGAILALIAVPLGAASNTVEVRFLDSYGTVITDCPVGVYVDGQLVQKASSVGDTYAIVAELGQKLQFEIDHPEGMLKTEAKIPIALVEPFEITVDSYSWSALPLAPPGNDLCDAAILVAVPSISSGTTVDATIDNPPLRSSLFALRA